MEVRFQVISIGSRFAVLKETFDQTGHRDAVVLEERFDARQLAEAALPANSQPQT